MFLILNKEKKKKKKDSRSHHISCLALPMQRNSKSYRLKKNQKKQEKNKLKEQAYSLNTD